MRCPGTRVLIERIVLIVTSNLRKYHIYGIQVISSNIYGQIRFYYLFLKVSLQLVGVNSKFDCALLLRWLELMRILDVTFLRVLTDMMYQTCVS